MIIGLKKAQVRTAAIVFLLLMGVFVVVFVSGEEQVKTIFAVKDQGINVLAFNQLNLSKSYSELERARAYSEFFMICESQLSEQRCNLRQNQFDSICFNLAKLEVPNGDCYVFYDLYLADETKKILVSEELANQYNLIKSGRSEEDRRYIWWILLFLAILFIFLYILIYRKGKKKK